MLTSTTEGSLGKHAVTTTHPAILCPSSPHLVAVECKVRAEAKGHNLEGRLQRKGDGGAHVNPVQHVGAACGWVHVSGLQGHLGEEDGQVVHQRLAAWGRKACTQRSGRNTTGMLQGPAGRPSLSPQPSQLQQDCSVAAMRHLPVAAPAQPRTSTQLSSTSSMRK